MSNTLITLMCALLIWTTNSWVTAQWFGPSYRNIHYNSDKYLAQSTKPFGMPNRKNLIHGYFDDGSSLNEYKRWHGETSILGIPGSDSSIGSYLRSNWPFNDFVSFAKTVRLQHAATFGKNTQVEAVTPYPIIEQPDYLPKNLMQAIYKKK